MRKAIILFQRDIRRKLPKEKEEEYQKILKLAKGSYALIFPEYLGYSQGISSWEEAVEQGKSTLYWLKELSKNLEETLVIGGSILKEKENKLYNVSPIFFQGKLLGEYRKRKLYGKELSFLTPGEKPFSFFHPVDRSLWGILICADIFVPSFIEEYSLVKFLAIPTLSVYKPSEDKKHQEERDKLLYERAAKEIGSYILKASSTGEVFLKEERKKLQGRSLVVSPKKGILFRAPSIFWEGFIVVDIEKEEVEAFSYEEA